MSSSPSKSWADTVCENNDQVQLPPIPSLETIEEDTTKQENNVTPKDTEEGVEDFEDQVIFCCDCNQEFMFDAGTQQFFITKNLLPPKRCFYCKQDKKDTHKKKFEGEPITEPHTFFCKICKLKHDMPVYEVIYFKQNGYELRTKCKKCKKNMKKN